MGKVVFKDYTNEQKKIMQDVLMFSPKCWKDGNFKFDRDNKKEPCSGKSCYECMLDTFDISANKL